MQISGLQKLTLIDYPKKLACTIFLQGCNFRCGFCHNPELVLPGRITEKYSEKQILEFLSSRKQYLEAVCITGGEPLLDPEVLTFIAGIKALGYLVKLDTNGSNPELLQKAIEKSLIDYIAMDIKSCKDDYDLLAGASVDIQKIEASIRLILNSGRDYEFRTTVIKGHHTPESLISIGTWVSSLSPEKPKKYCIQSFIPRPGKLINESFEKIPQFTKAELDNLREAALPYFHEVILKDNI